MAFRINDQKYNSSFEPSKKGFQHNRGSLIKLFPFATDTSSLAQSESDFETFKGITGKFYRDCYNISAQKTPSKTDLVESISSIVETDFREELKDIVCKLFFDEGDNIFLFNSEILPFLNFKAENAKLKNLQNYIANLLIDDEVKTIIQKSKELKNDNILYNLVIDRLKNLSETVENNEVLTGYYNGELVLEIRELFKEDLKHLINLKEFYIHNISHLIKYYYFQYVLRLAFKLNSFFDETKKTSPLFFTLNWEKLSRSRFALEYGWKKLELSVVDLFAHANCLELLNTIEPDKETSALNKPFTYSEILSSVKMMSEESEKDFAYVINKLIERYRERIQTIGFSGNGSWENFEANFKLPTESIYKQYHSLSLIYRLFSMIKYQFENSGRYNPYRDYSLWFKAFVKANYFKFRGSLGGTLVIDRNLLLLLTELSILSTGQDKILVSKLWLDLEKRGLYLDDKSKHEIIVFYEKINTLEKKSDSGEAQFVKRLYK